MDPWAEPPNGHSPGALVGWIQNINLDNEQADYFDDDDEYVETAFREYIGNLIDSDDARSPWYNPPRPYSEVATGARAALLGPKAQQAGGSVGVAMSDKPQNRYEKVSPRGGLLYRFGGVIEFSTFLVIMEPDGSRGTILEHIQWRYEYAFSLQTVPPDLRSEGFERPTEFELLYDDTYVVAQGSGLGRHPPNIEVSGTHGNAFFDENRATWENLPAARSPYQQRFPSFI